MRTPVDPPRVKLNFRAMTSRHGSEFAQSALDSAALAPTPASDAPPLPTPAPAAPSRHPDEYERPRLPAPRSAGTHDPRPHAYTHARETDFEAGTWVNTNPDAHDGAGQWLGPRPRAHSPLGLVCMAALRAGIIAGVVVVAICALDAMLDADLHGHAAPECVPQALQLACTHRGLVVATVFLAYAQIHTLMVGLLVSGSVATHSRSVFSTLEALYTAPELVWLRRLLRGFVVAAFAVLLGFVVHVHAHATADAEAAHDAAECTNARHLAAVAWLRTTVHALLWTLPALAVCGVLDAYLRWQLTLRRTREGGVRSGGGQQKL
jgi:hypothetical protein